MCVAKNIVKTYTDMNILNMLHIFRSCVSIYRILIGENCVSR